MAVQLTVPDTANSSQSVQIDGVSLKIEYRYLERNKGWEVSIYDDLDSPIILGCRVQPNMDLFSRYAFGDRLPAGLFACVKAVNTAEALGRDNFGVNKSYRMIFFSESELTNG